MSILGVHTDTSRRAVEQPPMLLLFTTNGVGNDVSAIDAARLKVVKSIAVGRFPRGLAVCRD